MSTKGEENRPEYREFLNNWLRPTAGARAAESELVERRPGEVPAEGSAK